MIECIQASLAQQSGLFQRPSAKILVATNDAPRRGGPRGDQDGFSANAETMLGAPPGAVKLPLFPTPQRLRHLGEDGDRDFGRS
ncbi:MAG: hypothetical protein RMK73_13895, partial [Geminicoccaceae bacterium]|nr:hypothetical protein [Geminicoccaceae bacterium]